MHLDHHSQLLANSSNQSSIYKEIEIAILSSLAVSDCVVIEKETEEFKQELIAYVVPSGLFLPEQILTYLQTILSSELIPTSIVPVSTLPLTTSGEIDKTVLNHLEIKDTDLLQRWTEQIQALPEVEQVAVVVQKYLKQQQLLRLSNLLSDCQTLINEENNTSVTSQFPSLVNDNLTDSRLAISHGGELKQEKNAAKLLWQILQKTAFQFPEKQLVYIQSNGTEIIQTYQNLLLDAQKILTGLRKLGLKPLDKVIFQIDQSQDFIPAFWGCILGGFVPVPVSIAPTYEQVNSAVNKLHNAWQMLEQPLILTSSRLVKSLWQLPALLNIENLQLETVDNLRQNQPDSNIHQSEQDDLALLLLTSGSTGFPKGVMLTHRNLLSMTAGAAQNNFSSQDIFLNWMPLEHVGAIVLLGLMAVDIGCQQIHVSTEYILQNPIRWLELIQRHQATISWAPNFAFSLLNERASEIKQRSLDLSSMRFIVNGGEQIVPKTARTFLKLLQPHGLPPNAIHPAFGMSETSSVITWSDNFSLATSSDEMSFVDLGLPIPGTSIRITDKNNQIVPEGVIGKLQVKGLSVTSGYYKNPERNREAFTFDGWFNTGDMGYLQSGRIILTGRDKDDIIINGINYYSHEIESVVEEIEGVEISYTAACAVRLSEQNTEQLVIFFSSFWEQNLLKELSKKIRKAVVKNIGINPNYIIPVKKEVIPKTAIGKIQRAQLSKMFLAGEFDSIIQQYSSHRYIRRYVEDTYPLEKFTAYFTASNSSVGEQLSKLVVRDRFGTPSNCDFIQLQQMPLTKTGIIDIDKLTTGELHQKANNQAQPLTDIERQIAQIWQQVLGLEEIGIDDNFFELGGHSLLLIQAQSQLQQCFGVLVSIVDMFKYPSISTLAKYLSQGQTESPAVVQGQKRALVRSSRHAEQTSDIAVIGMSCRFPGANNIDEFWQNLCNGVESISFFSDEEIIQAGVDPALVKNPNYVKAKPILSDVEFFDADFFGYSAKEAELIDPQQRLLLECAWQSLEAAGYNPLTYDGAIGIYAGAVMNTYLLNNIYPHRHQLDVNDNLQVATIDAMGGLQMMVANDKDYLTTRISYKLNLTGPSVNVQTACSTSLVAIHMACASLLSGESDMALAGGVSVNAPQKVGHLYQEGMIVTPDGHCRAFDIRAQGTIFGSGAGIVVLKRLEDAIADQDHIYAVVKGSAVNNDGGTKVGYMAPNGDGQAAVVTEAMAMAKVDADTISYIEAHGTGTPLGDPIEIGGLTQAFRASTQAKNFCAIGSVKTNVGHLQIASGVVGFIKTVLSLYHQKIPPSLHFEQPNPQLDLPNTPFYVNTSLKDWHTQGYPRRAGVNSLGIGGTNAHVILEEAPSRGRWGDGEMGGWGDKKRPYHILALSAKDEQALAQLRQRYLQFLISNKEVAIADVCSTANTGRQHFNHRLAVVAESRQQLIEQLADSTSPISAQFNNKSGKIAFLFTGQGSQYINMGRQLYENQLIFRQTIEQCDRILRPYLKHSLLEVLYPSSLPRELCSVGRAGGAGGEEEQGEKELLSNNGFASPASPASPASRACLHVANLGCQTTSQGFEHLLNQTAYTQPTLFAIEYALYQLWKSWGIEPDVVMGHSVGEYVAATVAGVFSLSDALKLIAHRGQLMQQLPSQGEMVAVMASEERVRKVIAPYNQRVAIAAINSPENVVISGASCDIAAVCQQLEAQQVKTKRLQVSHAFHSPLMTPMLTAFEAIANSFTYHQPQIPLVSNVTGEIADYRITTAQYWVNHIRQTVRFADGMQTLRTLGYQVFLEIGPQPILLGMGHQCLPDSESLWLPSLRKGIPEWQQMLKSLAQLYVQGINVNWSGFAQDYPHRKVALPTYPFQRQRYWIENTPPRHQQPQQTKLHPLLDKKLQLPLSKEILFESEFSTQNLPFLTDHQVYHQVVVPGACHLSLLLGAAKLTFASESCLLENIVFPQALVIPQDQARTVQLMLSLEASGTSFQLISFDTASNNSTHVSEWLVHATGKISKGIKTTPQTVFLQQIQARCTQQIAALEIYQSLQKRQIQLAASFQWLDSVWCQAGEALAKLKWLTVVDKLDEYQLHPGLLDSCLQVSSIFFSGDDTFVPFAIESFQFYQRPQGQELWCYAVQRQLENSQSDKLLADIRLFDAHGYLFADIKGFAAKKAPRKLLLHSLEQNTEDWLHEIHWQAVDKEQSTVISINNWLILTDSEGLGQQLAEQLQHKNSDYILVSAGVSYEKIDQRHYQIDPSQLNHWRKLLSLFNQQPLGIIHLWSIGQSETDNGNFEATELRNCGSVLYLLQALQQQDWQTSPHLWLVTQGTQAVKAIPQPVQLRGASLWGLGRTIALEHPELRCVRLDLSAQGTAQQHIQALLWELSAPDAEDQIAIRHGNRYVARLVRHQAIDLHQPGQLKLSEYGVLDHLSLSRPPSIQADASYLITGGCGALGLEVAQWLIQKGARHLVLVGRSEVSVATKQRISSFEQLGAKVLVVQADVSQVEQVVEVLAKIDAQLPPLRGIIHAAGVLDDGVLQQQSLERFRRVMAAKVAGAWNLHTLTLEQWLDFFVCFSSVSSLIGSAGQGNYAAANAFMDTLAYYRQALGLPGISINWGPWSQVGMAANLDSRNQNRIQTNGINTIAPQQGLAVLEQLLNQSAAQVAVIPFNWSKFLMNSSFSSSLFANTHNLAKKLEKSNFGDRLNMANTSDQKPLLVDHICLQVAQVLGRNFSTVDLHQSFFELGMDSLTAIELRNRLQNSLKCSVPPNLAFDYPTVTKLVDYLALEILHLDFKQSKNSEQFQLANHDQSDWMELEL